MSESTQPKAYVPVYVTYGKLAGEMIRLMLESMDIPALLSQESAGAVYGLAVGPLGEVTIFVPAEQAEEAQEILQAMDEGKLETSVNFGPVPDRRIYKENKVPREERLKDL